MDMNSKAKADNLLMLALKVNEISHVIAETDKGTLVMRLHKGGVGRDYRMVLDAVPFDAEKSKDIIGLIS